MIPKDILQKNEYEETIRLLKIVKKEYGRNAEMEVRKLLLVVAWKMETEPKEWLPYDNVLDDLRKLIAWEEDPTNLLTVKERRKDATFYGIRLTEIYNRNLLELMDYLINKKYENK